MVYYALFLHFIFDFILQSDWMALNKSKSFHALTVHAAVYSLLGLWFVSHLGLLIFSFVIWLFLTHWCIDAVTSRITSWLWGQNRRHWFFVVIGFDQLLHTALMLWWLDRAL